MNQPNWKPFKKENIYEINKLTLVQFLRKDGAKSFVLRTPIEMDEFEIETTTHWRSIE